MPARAPPGDAPAPELPAQHRAWVAPYPWERVVVLLSQHIIAVLCDSHCGSSLTSRVSSAQRLCAALMDLHEPFQLCHTLKRFPFLPPPLLAPVPLFCWASPADPALHPTATAFTSFSSLVSPLGPLGIFKAWPWHPKVIFQQNKHFIFKTQQSYSFQVALPNHNFSSFNGPVARGEEKAVLS